MKTQRSDQSGKLLYLLDKETKMYEELTDKGVWDGGEEETRKIRVSLESFVCIDFLPPDSQSMLYREGTFHMGVL